MGGGDGDWVLPCTCPAADITLVLVGKAGTGKSATANSILGSNVFVSEYSHTSDTVTCQMETVTLGHVNRTVKVIDAPGLFDMNVATEEARKEIVKCMDMSRDGIHAMLMVFSAASRFTCEDAEAIESIKMFFGDKILDHMILVFTNGDQVGETAFERILTDKGATYMQRMVKKCGHRVILFDNKTNDMQQQKKQQLEKLLDTIDSVIQCNGGKPFSNQMFTQIQEVNDRQKKNNIDRYSYKDTQKSKEEQYDEYLTDITKMVLEQLTILLKVCKNSYRKNRKNDRDQRRS